MSSSNAPQDNSTARSSSPGQDSSAAIPHILVAYFSHAGETYMPEGLIMLDEGNAAVLAHMAADACAGAADIFEIKTADPYPTGYKALVAQGKEERAANARPELTEHVSGFERYDTVILAYPNWFGTLPMPVFTFLESYDFTGKTLAPLCTHEGGGISRTTAALAEACPDAHIAEALAVAGSKARDSRSLVERWVRALLA